MIRAILAKEISQHIGALVLLFLLLMISTALVMVWVVTRPDSGSPLMGLRAFLVIFLPITIFILTDRLIRHEYTGKTQLFLESLPVSRLKIVLTKFFFGLAIVFVITTAVLAIVLWLTRDSELYTSKFILALILRTAAWTFFLYASFFMLAFLGRYRMALILFIVVGLFTAERMTALQINELSPFVIIGPQFAFERDVIPTRALSITSILSVFFVLIGILMAIAHEGSVASLLAEKMSHRERVFVVAAFISLMSIVAVVDEKAEKKPFDLKDAITKRENGVVVKISKLWGTSEREEKLAEKVVTEIAELSRFLDLKDIPPVFITYRGDLDGNRFERASLLENEGILVRVNYDDAAWNESKFLSWLIQEVLLERSHNRVSLEQKRWILDGFTLFWFTRGTASKPLHSQEKLTLRALYGSNTSITNDQLNSWLTYRERVGSDISSAVAWSGLQTLARGKGLSKTRKFLQLTLGTDVPQNFNALLYERNNSWEVLMNRSAGIKANDFLKIWNEELARARQQLLAQLKNLPKVNSEFRFVRLSPKTRSVHYKVHVVPDPGESLQYTILYRQLPPLDEEIDIRTLRKEEGLYSVSRSGELPLTFSSGGRFLATISINVEPLDCEVISGWIRQTIN